jgi:hypothetical protein
MDSGIARIGEMPHCNLLMKRKPPHSVVSISGQVREDTITQAELAKAAEAQESEWLANRVAAKAISSIEGRLLHGAEVENGRLYFDPRLAMVRSRRARRGVESPRICASSSQCDRLVESAKQPNQPDALKWGSILN